MLGSPNNGADRRLPTVPNHAANLRAGITRAAVDLFAAYGVTLPPADGVDAHGGKCQRAFLGVVGFGGSQVSGQAILYADEQILRRSNSTTSSSQDWMAELANQFLGRIKNGLRREGLHVHRVPPFVLKGDAGSVCNDRYGAPVLTMGDEDGMVTIWMKSEPSSEEDDRGDPEPDVLAEGEMLLF